MANVKQAELVFPDLSYRLVGLLFEVHKKLGNSLKEKYYQRGVENLLRNGGWEYERELKADLEIGGDSIGYYFIDFVIEQKIVLELKAKPSLHPDDFRQVMAYLRSRDLKLGILANFRPPSLRFHRILNSDVKEW